MNDFIAKSTARAESLANSYDVANVELCYCLRESLRERELEYFERVKKSLAVVRLSNVVP